MAINVSGRSAASGIEGIVPLGTIGTNILFPSGIGFDFYYENGFGKVADLAEGFRVIGSNFVYWIPQLIEYEL